MKNNIKQRTIAILLALIQMVTMVMPASIAMAEDEYISGEVNHIGDRLIYYMKVKMSETIRTDLAQNKYYIVVEQDNDGVKSYASRSFSDIAANGFQGFDDFVHRNAMWQEIHYGPTETASYRIAIAKMEQNSLDNMIGAFAAQYETSGNAIGSDLYHWELNGQAHSDLEITEAEKYDVEVNFLDYSADNIPAPEVEGNYYLIAMAVDNFNASTIAALEGTPYWYIKKLENYAGTTTPDVISIPGFSNQSNNGYYFSESYVVGKPYALMTDEEKESIKARLVHTTENLSTYNDLHGWATGNSINTYNEVINGSFPDYDVLFSEPVSDGDVEYRIGFQQGTVKELDVVLEFDPPEGKAAIPAGDYYIVLEATAKDGVTHYYKTIELTTDGTEVKTIIPADDNWSEGQHYSLNWQGVTAKVIKKKDGATITPGGYKPQDNSYTEAYVINNYTYTYSYVEEEDTANHKLLMEHKITLKYNPLEDALTPLQILGPGINYGVTAEKFNHTGHMQTNFATNYYICHGDTDVNVQPDLGNTTGSVVAANIEGMMHMNAPSDVVLFIDKYDADKVDNKLSNVIVVESTSDRISESIVDPIINHGAAMSEILAAKEATFAPKSNEIDLTQFPDGTTIYIDPVNIRNYFTGDGSGIKIHMHPNQVVVWNIPGETVSIGQILYTYTDGMNWASEGEGGGRERVATHNVFNMPDATTVRLNEAYGMFLIPQESAHTTVTQSSEGWLITGGEFTSQRQSNEWHSRNRSLTMSVDADLSFGKTVDEQAPKSGDVFEFELYQWDENADDDAGDTHWTKVATLTNSGPSMTYSVLYDSGNGGRVFKIKEKGKAENVSSSYFYDESEYYITVVYMGYSSVVYAAFPQYYTDAAHAIERFRNNDISGVPTSTSNFKGLIDATDDENAISAITFHNTKKDAKSAQLQVEKHLNSWGNATEFSFILKQVLNDGKYPPMPKDAKNANDITYEEYIAQDEPLPEENGTFTKTVTISKSEALTANFGLIKYNDAGVYRYTISEIIPDGAFAIDNEDFNNILETTYAQDKSYNYYYVDGTVYDNTGIPVTVTVEEADPEPIVTVQYGNNTGDKFAVFTNTYRKASTDLKATKTIIGKKFKFDGTDKWTFTVTAVEDGNSSNSNIPMPTTTSIELQPEDGTSLAEIDFGTIEYTIDDIGKTYIYTITETDKDGNPIKAEDITVAITENAEDHTLVVTRTPEESIISFVNFDEGKTSIKVEKIWVNSLGQTVTHDTGSATVQLIAVKTEVTPPEPTGNLHVEANWTNNREPANDVSIVISVDGNNSVTLNSANSWSGDFSGLKVGTHTLKATVQGENVTVTPEEKQIVITEGQNAETFAATYEPPVIKKDLTVSITWDGGAPENDIIANASDGSSVTLNSDNGWTGAFDNMVVGQEYTVTLTKPTGVEYTSDNPQSTTIQNSDDNALAFTGTYTPNAAELEVSINWNNVPSDVTVQVTAVNTANSNDAHSITFNADGNTQNWSETITGLTGNQTYTVTASISGDNADKATISDNSKTVQVSPGTNNVSFSGNYTSGSQPTETAELEVAITWNNIPSDIAVQITAVNTEDASDTKTITLYPNNSNNWTGTINGLTVGKTYSVSTSIQGGNAGNASISDSPKTVAIASENNNTSFNGTYSSSTPGNASIPVTINWDNEPSDVEVTVTAVTSNGGSNSKSITITGTGTTWQGTIDGLEVNTNYEITYTISGTNASNASLSPNTPQYVNSGSGLTYTGTYTSAEPIPEGKIRIKIYKQTTHQSGNDKELLNTAVLDTGDVIVTVTLKGNSFSAGYNTEPSVEGGNGNTPALTVDGPVDIQIPLTFTESREYSITFYSGWSIDNIVNATVAQATSNNGAIRKFNTTIRYIAGNGIADIRFTKTRGQIQIKEGLKQLSEIVGNISEGDYFLYGEPFTLQHSDDPEGEDWEHTWPDLPEYILEENEDGTTTIYKLTYYVIETTATGVVSNTYSYPEGNVVITNKEKTGEKTRHDKVTVNKQDEAGSSLPGATFNLYSNSACTTSVKEYTGESFDIKTEDLTSYLPTANGGEVMLYLKETDAPDGYLLDETVHNVVITKTISEPTYDENEDAFIVTTAYTMTIDSEKTIDLTNTEESLGEITLTKKNSAKTKALEGAEFDLYRVKTGEETADVKINTDGKLTTNADGQIIVGDLEPGDYYFIETKAPDGYVAVPEGGIKSSVETIAAGQSTMPTATVEMTNNEEGKGQITLTKKNSAKTKALEGAEFDLYRVKTGEETADVKINTDGKLTTNADGQIIVGDLEPGDYYFIETKAPDGYVAVPEGGIKSSVETIAAGQSTMPTATVEMTNAEEAKGQITLTKKNSAKTKALEGAEFDLYRVKTGEETADVKINTDGKLTTNADGQIIVGDLEPGDYYFIETKAPDGYVAVPEGGIKSSVETIAAGQSTMPTATVEMTNNEEGKGQITLTKKNSAKTKALEGAEFDLYRVKTGEETADVKINTDGKLTTNADGQIIVGDLEPGDYYFIETKAPDGYVAVPEGGIKSSVETIAAGQSTMPTATVEMTNNEEGKGQITLTKKNSAKTKALEGAEFDLYRVKTGEETADVKINTDGKLTTNADGQIIVGDLEPGDYYFIETKAPDGYVAVPEGGIKSSVETIAAGQSTMPTATVEMTNNEEGKGQITLTKKNSAKTKALEGAEFDLYRVKTGEETADVKINTDGKLTTNADGQIIVGDLEPGDYYFIETKAPDGYVAVPEGGIKSSVETIAAGQSTMPTATVEMTNAEEAKGQITLTKKNSAKTKALEGAEFDLYRVKTGEETADVKINTDGKLTTNADGQIIVGDLEPGDYYFIETKAPDGYVAVPEGGIKSSVETIAAGQSTMPTATVEMTNNEEGKGQITLTKKNGAKTKALEGAEFDLYRVKTGEETADVKINTDGKLTTNADGQIIVGDLEPGDYYFIETKAPDGYVAVPEGGIKSSVETIAAGQSTMPTATVEMTNNEEGKGQITLTKKNDAKTKALEGAEFDLYRVKTGEETADVKINTDGKLTTNADGQIIVGDLEPGDYYFIETKAPDGYVAVPEGGIKSSVETIAAGQSTMPTATVEMTNNEEGKGQITLTKKNSAKTKALEGAEFDLYRVKTGEETADVKINTDGKLTTNADGQIIVGDLEPGDYYFIETKAPDGYVAVPEGGIKSSVETIAAGQSTMPTATVEMTNNEEGKGQITLTKKNSAKTKALEGAEFDLYRVKTGEETADVKINTDGKLTTNADGQIIVGDLEPGDYYFIETKAPDGYVAVPEGGIKSSVETIAAGQSTMPTATVEMTNAEEAKGQITLTKKNSAKTKALEGAEFDLYRVKTGEETADVKINTDGKLTTNADGQIIVGDLEPGDYYFIETKAPDGYVAVPEGGIKSSVETIAAGQSTMPTATVEMTNNEEGKGQITLTKKNSAKTKALEGAEFDLYRVKTGEETADVKINTDGKLTTNADGQIIVGDLEPGDYYFIETKAPDGYVAVPEGGIKSSVETIAAGQSTMPTATVEMTNAEEAKGQITLTKKNSAKTKALEGAEFDLYRVKTGEETADVKINTDGKLTTNADGQIIVGDLEPGDYYFIETKAPDGYVAVPEGGIKSSVETIAAGQSTMPTATVEMTNNEEGKGQITLTKKNSAKTKALEGAEFDLYRVKTGEETADVKINTDGKLTTNADGQIIVGDLEPGDYYFIETKAPDGYVAVPEGGIKSSVETIAAGQSTMPTATVEMTNAEEAKGQITLTKKNSAKTKALEGAEFDLYRVKTGEETADVKINTDGKLTTNADGQIIVGDLEPGDYYFIETKAPDGYVAVPEGGIKSSVETIAAGQSTMPTATVEMTNNEEGKGQITLTKKNSAKTKALEGAEFDLYRVKTGEETADVKINTDGKLTTNADGQIIVGDLEPGDYYFIETKAPDGYVAVPEGGIKSSVETIAAGQSTMPTATVEMTNNEEGKGQITLTKKNGAKTKALEGAEFDLYRVKTGEETADVKINTDGKLTTNADGQIIVGDLEPGDYYFIETKAPDGYVAVPEGGIKSSVETIAAGQSTMPTATVEMTNNEEGKGQITLTKKNDAKTKALEGAEFDLYRVKTGEETADVKINTDGKLTTNADGQIIVGDLEPGDYYFIETKAPDGYVAVPEGGIKSSVETIAAGQSTMPTATVEMTNNEEGKGQITLTKKNSAKTKALEGAEFDLYRVKTSEETADVKINTDGKLTTNADGQIIVGDLEPGDYYFIETKAPDGYVAVPEGGIKSSVETIAAGQSTMPTATVEMTNNEEGKGQITLTKKNSAKTKALEGAEFDLYRVKTGEETADVKINTDGKLTTNADGQIIVGDLEPGDYYFIETKAPDGYVAVPEGGIKSSVETIAAGQSTMPTATVEMTNNEEGKGQITLTKKNGAKTKALEGAEFDLYRVKTGEETADVKINTDGKLTTNADGQIIVGDLEPGDYYFIETKAPDGYVAVPEGGIKSSVETIAAGQSTMPTATVEMTNNEEGKGQITLTKKNGAKTKALEGAEFDLYRVKTGEETADVKINTDGKLTTNADGQIIVGDLEPGDYYFIETKAPDGYVAVPEGGIKSSVETIAAGQSTMPTATVEMTNAEEAKGQITLTKKNSAKTKALEGAEFDLYRVKTGEETADVKINTDGKLTTNADGQIIVGDLEPGDYYFIETKAPDGYVAVPEGGIKSSVETIAAGQSTMPTATVEMTNNEEGKGQITLTKKNSAKTKALEGAEFDLYRVKTGEETADVKINTDGKLTTNADGQIIVGDLEPGDYYFIETKAPDGYVAVPEGGIKSSVETIAAGQSTMPTATVEMTNNEEGKGQITLTKKNSAKTKALEGAEFDLYRVKTGEETADVKINTDGKLTTNADGQIIVGDLEPGDYYFIETKAPDGYVAVPEGGIKSSVETIAAGQSTMPTATVEMTNAEEAKGQITLTKLDKDDNTKKLSGAKFDLYRVKTGSETEDKKINTKELVTDKNGEITVTDLEPGTYYFVEIAAPENYVTPSGEDAKTDTRIVEAGKATLDPLTVSVENTHKVGDLVVSKTVVSDAAADKDQKFIFTIELSDKTIEGKYGDMTFDKGVAKVELKGGENAKAEKLPVGTEWKITEAADDNFDQDKNEETGKIVEDGCNVEFTNTRKTGDLEVSKTVVSDAAADADQKFTFTIKLSDETISGTYGDMTFEKGIATVELKGGENATAKGLPTAIDYTVTEAVDENFTVEKTGDTGTIVEAGCEAAFTNARKTGDLTVSKTVVSDAAADADQKFTFTIKLSDETISGTYGDMTFEKGIATVELKGGENATAKGLPTAIDYTVTEAVDENFTVEKTGDTGTIVEAGCEAAFTNARKTGDLKISKEVVSDAAADAEQKFTFTIELSDKTISGTYGDMTFEKGVATVELKGGESTTAKGLPTGIDYTVTEAVDENFKVTKTGDTGTIDEAGCEAAFTNTRTTGDLEISKTVVSFIAADADQKFTFTIELSDKTISGTYGDMTFEKGIATVELKGGESATAEGLPTGIDYQVTEATEEAFNTEKTGDTGTIDEAGCTAAFTNTRKTANVKVSKVDVASGEELEGATIQILRKATEEDAADEKTKYADETKTLVIVEEWVSSDEAHEIEGLLTDTEYTLRETVAPDGYTVTVDTTFTIDETGKVTSTGTVSEDGVLLVEDAMTRIRVSKVDAANGEELEGATIQILRKATEEDAADKNTKYADEAKTLVIVEEWVSETEAHVVEGLLTDTEYILRETVAPHGYDVTTDTMFIIDETGKVTSTGTISEDGVLLVEDDMFLVCAAVKKVWNDEENRDGRRPLKVTVDLLANGTVVRTIDLTAENHWMAVADKLPMVDKALKTIEYTWAEHEPGNGYKLTGNVKNGTLTTLTNSRDVELTEVSVEKKWNDNGNASNMRPDKIRVQLYADGEACGEEVVLNAGNGWKHTWTGLKKNCNKTAIAYTVEELEVPEGYQVSKSGNAAAGYVLTNTLETGSLVIRKTFDIEEIEPEEEPETELIDINVKKVWNDSDDQDGIRPESITVHLLAGGEMIDTVQLKATTGWKYTFKDLPKTVRGNRISYSVTEDPVPGYTCEVHGYTIRNTHKPEETNVSVRKVWDDRNNALGIRPTSIRMTLSNGTNVLLSEANGWQATITGLPKRMSGEEINYTWVEQEVVGYRQESKTVQGSVTTFTNTPTDVPNVPEGMKKPKLPGGEWAFFEEYQTALGVETIINHVGDCFD